LNCPNPTLSNLAKTEHLSNPLVVDLDGTLILTDMLHESTLKVVREKPWELLRIPFWLLNGKAHLKQQLATRYQFSPHLLPYNEKFLQWLKQQRTQGRYLVLCTASNQAIADSINQHLDLFDEVIGSDGTTNLKGNNKAEYLVKRFGNGGFDYAGNSEADMQIWQYARAAIAVNVSNDLRKRIESKFNTELVIPGKPRNFRTWMQLVRAHQWLKNLLLFVPIIAAHQFSPIHIWVSLLMAFVAFNLCASSVYLTNDLLDLDSDRSHPRKRMRPFAAGSAPVSIGMSLAPAFFVISMMMAWAVEGKFFPFLVLYFTLSCAYSWGLKRIVLVDCVTLAMLYTVRIIAGAMAAGLGLSFWLLAFSVFLFLSLAFVKRFAELVVHINSNKIKTHGRGYLTSDAPLIQTLGISSGYASVLVLALYLNSSAVLKLYNTPEFIWGTVPLMAFWVSWMWMRAHRGEMHDDPLVFALTDKASILTGFLFAGFLWAGTVSWPW